jgi:serine/threonine protein kinase
MLIPSVELMLIPSVELQWSTRSLLGSGSFGLVFEAQYGGSRVACKKLGDRAKTERFMLEMQKLQLADHPRVVRLFGVALYEEEPVAVMEYCGANLAELLPMMGGMQPELASSQGSFLVLSRVLRWCLSVAQGMRALHQRHIIHRDLALRNIVVGPLAADAVRAWMLAPHQCPRTLISRFAISGCPLHLR